MATRLEQLVADIDPSRTLDEIAARADRAILSFHTPAGRIGNWDEYRMCLVRFLRHVEAAVLRIPSSLGTSTDFDWGRCVRFLMQEYGVNGEKAAFEMVRTGNDGGLLAVLRSLARRVVERYATNEITARIGEWWKELSVDEQLAAGTEYVRKYGHLLPSELTEGSAVRIRANLPRVLAEHPRLLRELRRVGR